MAPPCTCAGAVEEAEDGVNGHGMESQAECDSFGYLQIKELTENLKSTGEGHDDDDRRSSHEPVQNCAHLWRTPPAIHRAEPFCSFSFIF